MPCGFFILIGQFGINPFTTCMYMYQVDPEMRVRFTSPHPKDFPDEVGH